MTPDGSYEFMRMPFGMKNSEATLVRGMRKLLQDMDNVECYIDDLIRVFSIRVVRLFLVFVSLL